MDGDGGDHFEDGSRSSEASIDEYDDFNTLLQDIKANDPDTMSLNQRGGITSSR